MDEAEAQVADGRLAVDLLEDLQRDVDRAPAHHVHAQRPAQPRAQPRDGAERLGGRDLDAAVAAFVGIGLAHQRRAQRGPAVQEHLDAADLQPRVAEAGVQAQRGDGVQRLLQRPAGVGQRHQHRAHAELALPPQLLVEGQQLGRHARVHDAGETGGVVGLLDVAQRLHLLFARRRRHQPRHRLEGGRLQQQAVGLARRVAFDAAARRVGGVGRDAGQRQRAAVRHAGVAHARQVDRAIRAGGVELLPRRVALFGQAHHVPAAAAGDPRCLGVGLGVGAHGGLHVGDASRLGQVDQAGLDAGPVHVVVRVDEPRHHGAAAEAHLAVAGAGGVARVGQRAHRDDAPVADGHGLGTRVRRVHRDQLATHHAGRSDALHDNVAQHKTERTRGILSSDRRGTGFAGPLGVPP